MLLYKIKDWAVHFETEETMGLPELRRVPFPTKHDGDGYNELVRHRHGPSYFGAWCALVQVASKCTPRGTLIRDGNRPHDSASLARQTRLPKRLFDSVFPRLLKIDWLEVEETQGSLLAPGPSPPVGKSATEVRSKWKRLEPDRSKSTHLGTTINSSSVVESNTQLTEEKKKKIALSFPVIAGRSSEGGMWDLTEDHLAELAETFPAVDCPAEAKKARGWIVANPTKRKTAGGMPAFLYRWIARVQNSGGSPGFRGQGGPSSGENRNSSSGSAAQRRSDKLSSRDYERIGADSLAYDAGGEAAED